MSQPPGYFTKDGQLFDADKKRVLSCAQEIKNQEGRTLFLKKGYREFSAKEIFEFLLNSITGSAFVTYSNDSLVALLLKNYVCLLLSIGADVQSIIGSVMGMGSTIGTLHYTMMMRMGAEFNKKKKQESRVIFDQSPSHASAVSEITVVVHAQEEKSNPIAEEKPVEPPVQVPHATFGRWDKLIKLALFLHCTGAYAMGAYMSGASLPATVAHRDDLIYDWWAILIGCVFVVLGTRGERSLLEETHTVSLTQQTLDAQAAALEQKAEGYQQLPQTEDEEDSIDEKEQKKPVEHADSTTAPLLGEQADSSGQQPSAVIPASASSPEANNLKAPGVFSLI